jgi:2-polyprenyl-3-methyl-5-hydroxy-6-metoxy-1,4-benzoquinol methylase
MIEIAKRKAEEQGVDNVTFETAAIEDLEVADESIDAVLGMSILHLLKNREEAIARVFRMLKPGGVFVSSTACIADMMVLFKYIVPVGRFLRLFPQVQVISVRELEQSLADAGFVIDRHWQSGKGKAVFIVAMRED